MTFFVTMVHVLVCVLLIGVVLLQRGKGAEIGAVFGGGASSTLFGSRGAATFLSKLTSIGAVVFMVTSFYLAYVAVGTDSGSVLDRQESATPTPPDAATPAATPAAGGDFVELPAAGTQPTSPAAAPATEHTPSAQQPETPAADSSGTGNDASNSAQ